MNNQAGVEIMTLLAIWRRTDEPGHDVVELKQTDLGWLLNGAAVYGWVFETGSAGRAP